MGSTRVGFQARQGSFARLEVTHIGSSNIFLLLKSSGVTPNGKYARWFPNAAGGFGRLEVTHVESFDIFIIIFKIFRNNAK